MGAEPGQAPPRLWPLASALVVLAAGLPLLLYWAAIGRSPSVSPDEARQFIAAPGSQTMLVDAREPAERAAQPLPEAAPWPASAILVMRSAADVPAPFQNRPLLLLCSGGVTSALAVQRLEQLGLTQAANIRGGYQSWIATAPAAAWQPTTRPEQLALVVAVAPIKLIYMLLALGLMVVLWGAAEAPLAALRWSMLFFLAGELCCGINIIAFNEESLSLEFWHSWGMVVSVGCLAYAVVEALDHGLIHYSDPRVRCAFAKVCQGCAKVQAVPCLVLRLFRWSVPLLAIVAAMPLAAQPAAVGYNTAIFGITRNLMHPVIIQLYEDRFVPMAAMVLLGAAWLLLWAGAGGLRLSKVFLAAGLGHLSFAFMRLTLLAYFQNDLVWFVFWEEATELMLVSTLVFGVWVVRPDQVKRAAARLPALAG